MQTSKVRREEEEDDEAGGGNCYSQKVRRHS